MNVSMSNSRVGNNQSGLVAIIITMIMMIVLTLILLGFSQLARREQRQTLDRQLSTQAQYAAESGINLARKYLVNNPDYNWPDCDENPAGLKDYNDVLDPTANVEITCLIVNNKNENIPFSSIVPNRSTVAEVLPNANPSELTIKWQDAIVPPVTGIDPPADLPPPSNWGADNIGMLRIDLVNTASAASIGAPSFSAFLKPDNDAATTGSVAFTAAPGQLVGGNCNAAGYCTVKITTLPASTSFAIRMTAIYRAVSVDIRGLDGSSDTLTFSRVPQIDVTARAADVLRRIRVRVPTGSISNTSDVFPEFAIDTAGGLCKQIKTSPTGTTVAGCP